MPSEPSEAPDPPPPPRPPHPTSSGRPGPTSPFAAPRRLHPASVLLGIRPMQFLQAVLFPAAATLAAGRAFTVTLLVLLGIAGLVVRFLAWQRFRFSFDGEVLRVEEGVLSRTHRALDVDRVQQVEIDRRWVARPFGLAALRVETAGSSSEAEAELAVLPEADAVALRDAIRAGQQHAAVGSGAGTATGATIGSPPARGDTDAAQRGPLPASPTGGEAPGATTTAGTTPTVPREVLRVPLRHVVLAGITGAQLLVLPAALGGLVQLAGGPDDPTAVDTGTLLDYAARFSVVVLVLLGAAAAVVAAVATSVLRDANYRIERIGDDLHVRRGLLSTRDSVVPLRRVQLVQLRRNPLRRALGFTALRVHSAGGSGQADRRVNVPLLPGRDVDRLLPELVPTAGGVPALRAHPSAARRRAVARWVRAATWLVAVLLVVPRAAEAIGAGAPWSTTAAAIGAPVVVAGAVALGLLEHRHLAHAITDRVLVARSGALSITTGVVPLVKVQSVELTSSPFQRRLGLATVAAHVAGPGGDLHVLDAGERAAAALAATLARAAAAPTPVEHDRPPATSTSSAG